MINILHAFLSLEAQLYWLVRLILQYSTSLTKPIYPPNAHTSSTLILSTLIYPLKWLCVLTKCNIFTLSMFTLIWPLIHINMTINRVIYRSRLIIVGAYLGIFIIFWCSIGLSPIKSTSRGLFTATWQQHSTVINNLVK